MNRTTLVATPCRHLISAELRRKSIPHECAARQLAFATAALLGVAFCGVQAQAANLTWDASGTATTNPTDGSGSWDTTGTNLRWNTGAADLPWDNTLHANDTAVIGNNNGAAGTITLNTGITAGGLTFNATGSGNYTITGNTLTLSGTPTITANVDAAIGSTLSVAGTLSKAGTGTLTLTGGASLARFDINNGKVTVASGTYTTSSFFTLNTSASGPATYTQTGGSFTSAAGLYIANGGGATSVANLNGGSFTTTGDQTWVGRSGGNGTLNIGGAGTLTTAATSYNGTTSVINLGDGTTFAGGADIAGGGTSGMLATNYVNNLGTSSTFNFNGGTIKATGTQGSFINALSSVNVKDAGGVVDNAGFTVGITNSLLHGGVASTDGGMVFKGSGTTYLTGASTYNGDTRINAGTLQLNTAGSLGSGNYAGAIVNNGLLQDSSSANQTLSGVISGTGSLTKDTSSSSALTLSGANTYSGASTLAAGTLNINNATALGNGAGTFAINGGTIDSTSGGAITLTNNNALTLGGNFAYGGTQDLNLGTGATTLAAQRTVALNGSHTLTLGGSVSGAGGFFTTGTGNLTLTGANTFTGVVQLNGTNILTINSAAALGNGTGGNYIAIQSGSTLRYTGTGSETTTARDLYWNSGAATIDTTSAAANLTFDITGGTRNNTFTKAGAGQLTLKKSTAINELTGSAFNITGGTVEFAQNNANAITRFGGAVTGSAGTHIKVSGTGYIGNESLTANWSANQASLDIGGGASFDLRGQGITIDALTGAGTVANSFANGTNTLVVGINNGSGAFSGVIKQTAPTGFTTSGSPLTAFTKTGTGIQTLSGANLYTGLTNIGGGTLALNLASNSQVIKSGNTLNFNGGTLDFSANSANIQTLGTTTVVSGANFITNSGGSGFAGTSVVDLGTLSVTSGSLNIAGLQVGSKTVDNAPLNKTWIKASGLSASLNFINPVITTNNGRDLVATDSAKNLIIADSTDYRQGATAFSNHASSVVRLVSTGTFGRVNNGGATITLDAPTQVTAGTTEWGTLLNAYTGGTTVVDITNANTLRLGVSGGITNAAGSDTTLGASVATGGTLTAGGSANTAGSITVSGTNNTLVNAKVRDNGSGTVSMVMSGPGTLTMAGASDYTGSTTVNGGKLLLTGTHNAAAGAYSVGAGGKLGGTGTLTTTGSVAIAGQITGGDFGTLGTLNIAGAGTRTLTGTYLFDVDYGAQTGDVLNVTGASSVDIGGGTFKLGSELGSRPVSGSHYAIKIFSSDLAVTGAPAGQSDYAGITSGLAPDQSIVTWDGGRSYYLVPEPASLALWGLGCLLLLRRPARGAKSPRNPTSTRQGPNS